LTSLIRRPTFDPARGRDKNQAPTRAFHAKALPAHTKLKLRRLGQTSEVEVAERDLRAELLAAEAEHRKKTGRPGPSAGAIESAPVEDDSNRGEKKRLLENGEEDEETAKRRKILEEARELDAESEDESSDDRSDILRDND
jgi:protein CWC15